MKIAAFLSKYIVLGSILIGMLPAMNAATQQEYLSTFESIKNDLAGNAQKITELADLMDRIDADESLSQKKKQNALQPVCIELIERLAQEGDQSTYSTLKERLELVEKQYGLLSNKKSFLARCWKALAALGVTTTTAIALWLWYRTQQKGTGGQPPVGNEENPEGKSPVIDQSASSSSSSSSSFVPPNPPPFVPQAPGEPGSAPHKSNNSASSSISQPPIIPPSRIVPPLSSTQTSPPKNDPKKVSDQPIPLNQGNTSNSNETGDSFESQVKKKWDQLSQKLQINGLPAPTGVTDLPKLEQAQKIIGLHYWDQLKVKVGDKFESTWLDNDVVLPVTDDLIRLMGCYNKMYASSMDSPVDEYRKAMLKIIQEKYVESPYKDIARAEGTAFVSSYFYSSIDKHNKVIVESLKKEIKKHISQCKPDLGEYSEYMFDIVFWTFGLSEENLLESFITNFVPGDFECAQVKLFKMAYEQIMTKMENYTLYMYLGKTGQLIPWLNPETLKENKTTQLKRFDELIGLSK